MATQAAVDLVVRNRATGPINQTTAAANKLSAAAKGTAASLHGASTAAKGLGASLAASLGPIIAIGAAISTVGTGLRVFRERERDARILLQGLKNLEGGTRSLFKLQKVADKLGRTTLFNQEDFTRGFNLLTSFRKIGVDSYERVARAAADVAQVNQVDVKTSFMQLAKALQDPERNLAALNRSGIAFTETQRKMINELMEANRVAEAHAMILDIVDESYKGLAEAGATGFAGDIDDLGESWRDFAEVLGSAVIPLLTPLVKALTGLLNILTKVSTDTYILIGALIGTGGLVFALKSVIGTVKALNLALSLNPWTALAMGVTAAGVALYRNATAHERFIGEVASGMRPLSELEQKIEDLSAAAKKYHDNQKEMEEGGIHKFRGQIAEVNQFGGIEGLEAEIKKLIDLHKQLTEQAKGYKLEIEDTTVQTKLLAYETQRLQETFQQVGQTIKDGVGDSIMAAVEGTKTLGEVASNVLKQIGRQILESGVDQLFAQFGAIGLEKSGGKKTGFWGSIGQMFGGVLGGGPTPKAAGGPVSGGSPYLVGEKGPELFVPSSGGNIVPNNAMGGMTINVDAAGSSVEGDAGRSRELGQLIGAAVQAEIGRQQRPGGILY